jgi:hypothetical protein
MTKTYDLNYDGDWLATIVIDLEKSKDVIKEMVEFWGGYEHRLDDNGGDYVKTWLKQLSNHILYDGKPPHKDDEGWVPLDGSFGIKVVSWQRYEFDGDLIEVEEVR